MMKEELNVDIYMKVAVNICNTQHAIGHELGYLKLSRDSTGAVSGRSLRKGTSGWADPRCSYPDRQRGR